MGKADFEPGASQSPVRGIRMLRARSDPFPSIEKRKAKLNKKREVSSDGGLGLGEKKVEGNRPSS